MLTLGIIIFFFTLFVTIVLIIFHYFFEDPSPYIFTSSWKISSKSITYCLSYFDFRHIFDPCDLDLWRLSVIIELVRARIFLHHPTKWRQNRSVTFWDILITRAWQTNRQTDRQTNRQTDKQTDKLSENNTSYHFVMEVKKIKNVSLPYLVRNEYIVHKSLWTVFTLDVITRCTEDKMTKIWWRSRLLS